MEDTSLIEAIKASDVDSVLRALRARCDVNYQDESGWAALHWAVQQEERHLADMMLEAGADVNLADKLGFTPLALAVGDDKLQMVELLLSHGASPNVRIISCHDGTVLHLACSWGHEGVAQRLVGAGADPYVKDNEGKTPVEYAEDAGIKIGEGTRNYD